jgi:hypothetical protein
VQGVLKNVCDKKEYNVTANNKKKAVLIDLARALRR